MLNAVEMLASVALLAVLCGCPPNAPPPNKPSRSTSSQPEPKSKPSGSARPEAADAARAKFLFDGSGEAALVAAIANRREPCDELDPDYAAIMAAYRDAFEAAGFDFNLSMSHLFGASYTKDKLRAMRIPSAVHLLVASVALGFDPHAPGLAELARRLEQEGALPPETIRLLIDAGKNWLFASSPHGYDLKAGICQW